MPRNGAGLYALPVNTKAVSGQPAEAADVNARFDDLAADANGARPISTGGTGGTTAAQARANIGLGGDLLPALSDVTLPDGGLLVGGASGVDALPLGAVGQVLTRTSGGVAWSAAPVFTDSVSTSSLRNRAVTAAKADIASQASAEAGTGAPALMTQERTAQAIAAQAIPSPASPADGDTPVWDASSGEWAYQAYAAFLAENGYQRLPSGLLLQWGHKADTGNPMTIDYPVTFSTRVFSVQVQLISNDRNDGNTTVAGNYQTFLHRFFVRWNSVPQAVTWFAVGV